MNQQPVILGIETSCDDTAAAVVAGGKLISSVISSQEGHAAFGGVVPELASRAHQQLIVPVVESALSRAGLGQEDLDAVAVTRGPGLAGSLLVGMSFAKAFAYGLGIPLVGVNHLDGHVYSLFIGERQPAFPFLCLIVSGGHTQLVKVDRDFGHKVLGRTRDDAAGEAFDKVAKLLGLAYPGGPEIEKHARTGNPEFHEFPRSYLPGLDFSFSGIKTSVLYYLNSFPDAERRRLLDEHMDDLCASFQAAVLDMLIRRVKKAVRETGCREIAAVGGVSANRELQTGLKRLADQCGGRFLAPEPVYCTDNAAMIAMAGYQKLLAGAVDDFSITIDPSLAMM